MLFIRTTDIICYLVPLQIGWRKTLLQSAKERLI
nr:MAG TPA: hypothetical protein [Caudoviricetes sp.]